MNGRLGSTTARRRKRRTGKVWRARRATSKRGGSVYYRGRSVSVLDALDARLKELTELPDGWYVNPDGTRLGRAPSWTALMSLRRFAIEWMPDDVDEDLLPDVEGGVSVFYDGTRAVVRVRFPDEGVPYAELHSNEIHPLDLTDIPLAVESVRALLKGKR